MGNKVMKYIGGKINYEREWHELWNTNIYIVDGTQPFIIGISNHKKSDLV